MLLFGKSTWSTSPIVAMLVMLLVIVDMAQVGILPSGACILQLEENCPRPGSRHQGSGASGSREMRQSGEGAYGIDRAFCRRRPGAVCIKSGTGDGTRVMFIRRYSRIWIVSGCGLEENR